MATVQGPQAWAAPGYQQAMDSPHMHGYGMVQASPAMNYVVGRITSSL